MTRSNPSSVPVKTAECVSYRLRRAARLAAKAFDAALKATGLRNTQFTILAALVIDGEKNIGELAEALATDATTLNRNLERLVSQGFIENIAKKDARMRHVRISQQGLIKYEEALPIWQKVQTQITERLDEGRWVQMIDELEQIEDACNV